MQQSKSTGTIQRTEVKCSICKDTGMEPLGDNLYRKCKCAEIEYLKRLWANFGVKDEDVKKLNDYKPFDDVTKMAKDKAVQYIKDFDALKGNRENSFGLYGQSGSGKTHIIVAIGSALLNRVGSPVPVVYMPYVEAMKELKANTMDTEYYTKLVTRYQKTKLLIIDDLFKDKTRNGVLVGQLSEADLRHIYPIINYRYLNHLPIIFSTECNPNMLEELDEAIAGRILQTCGDNITIFSGKKYNYRMRKFEK